uniref:non-specific serine/threonine protein kinase n=1 Tax=Heterorhabditis bacteriophora TaxID=37862 RepID=A0A1I7X6X8_HETBA
MSPPSSVKPGVIKDPAVAALFSNKDPESRYDDLREIGHGSFGAVFFAFDKERGETVAIKKMAFSGKQANEKWADILKEVAFLNKIKHQHIVEYRACFLKEQTCWVGYYTYYIPISLFSFCLIDLFLLWTVVYVKILMKGLQLETV